MIFWFYNQSRSFGNQNRKLCLQRRNEWDEEERWRGGKSNNFAVAATAVKFHCSSVTALSALRLPLFRAPLKSLWIIHIPNSIPLVIGSLTKLYLFPSRGNIVIFINYLLLYLYFLFILILFYENANCFSFFFNLRISALPFFTSYNV